MSTIGVDCVLSYATDGVSGGTWVTHGLVKTVGISPTKDEADDTVRANNGWKSNRGTLKDIEFTIEMRQDWSDPGVVAFRDAWINNTHLGIRAFDDAGYGWECDVDVIDIPAPQEIDGVVMIEARCKIRYIDTAPAWVNGA